MGAATRRAFWNAAQDAFAETRAEGAASATITASTQVCALMAGLFPRAKVRQAARNLIEPPMGWLATGTPWMWALGARHSLESGWTEQVLSGMRRFWGGMLDRGATTAWEMFEGRHRPGLPTRSWCHGWAAGPAWLLPAYVLGVRPASPGWKSVTISPLCGPREPFRRPTGSSACAGNAVQTAPFALKPNSREASVFSVPDRGAELKVARQQQDEIN